MNAYDKIYLEKARTTLGNMLDYAVNHLGMNAHEFWDRFLVSEISERFASGESSIIVGKSGIELCFAVTGKLSADNVFLTEVKSHEYWAGWALGYYQWKTGLSFGEINQSVAIEDVIKMYSPYHEMDIRQFCDRMDELLNFTHAETNLKRKRKALRLTQSQLAEQTGIPLRTIQQYEQGQKNINGARSEYLIAFSKALCCQPNELLEMRDIRYYSRG